MSAISSGTVFSMEITLPDFVKLCYPVNFYKNSVQNKL
jgi:hypothetical protein